MKGDSGAGIVEMIPEREAGLLLGVLSSGGGEHPDQHLCIPPNKVPLGNQFTFVPRVVDWILDTIKANSIPYPNLPD